VPAARRADRFNLDLPDNASPATVEEIAALVTEQLKAAKR